ncbi:hypothetical protein BH11PLA1_BH11PLA1_17560 [soil metagenome]
MTGESWQSEPENAGFWDGAKKPVRAEGAKRGWGGKKAETGSAGDASSADGASGGWGDATSQAPIDDPEARRRNSRRRWKWILLSALGAAVVGVIVLVVMLPTIAGWMLPRMVRRAAAARIVGAVEVEEVSLSWGGPQRLGRVRLMEAGESGSAVAEASVSAPVSLLALLRGNYDLGEVEVNAAAAIVRGADGVTNLQRALAEAPNAPPPSGEAARVPASLACVLNVQDVSVKYVDARRPDEAAQIRGMKGTIAARVGEPLAVKLSGAVEGAAKGDGGVVAVNLKAAAWCAEDGEITLKTMKVEGSVIGERVPVAALDVLTGAGGALRRVLGDRMEILVEPKVAGVLRTGGGTVRVKVSTGNAAADVTARLERGVVSAQSAGAIVLRGAGAAEAAREMLARGGVSVSTWPDVRVEVRSVSIPLPTGPDVAVGKVACDVGVEIGAAAGTVGGSGPSGGAARMFTSDPVTLSVVSAELMREIAVEGTGAARIDGQPAGVLAAKATVSDALTASGTPRLDAARLSGAVALRGVATALLEPLAAGSGFVLASDVGPRVDVEIAGSSAGGKPGATVKIASAKVSGSARIAYAPGEIVLEGEGARVVWSGAGAFAARRSAAGDAAAHVVSGAGATARALGEILPVGSATVVLAKASWAEGAAAGKTGAEAVLNALEAAGSVALEGWRVRRGDGAEIPIESAKLTASLERAGALVVGVEARGGREDGGASVESGRSPLAVKIDGRIGVPLKFLAAETIESRLRLGVVSVDASVSGPREVVGLLAPGARAAVEAVASTGMDAGQRAGVSVRAKLVQGGDRLSVEAEAAAGAWRAVIACSAGAGEARITRATVDGMVTDEMLARLGASAGAFAVQAPAKFALALAPVVVPMDAGLVPRADARQALSMSLALPEGVALRVREEAARANPALANLGSGVMVEPTTLSVTAAPAAFAAGGMVEAEFATGLRGGGGSGGGGGGGGARLRTEKPLVMTLERGGEFAVRESAVLICEPDLAWLNRVLAEAQGENAAGRERVRVVTLAPVRIGIERLMMDLGAGAGGPGAETRGGLPRSVSANIEIVSAGFAGVPGGPLRLEGARLETGWSDPGAIDVKTKFAGARLGDGPASGGAELTVRFEGAATRGGVLTPQAARVSAEGALPTLPTAVLALFTAQGPLLAETLGETASVTLRGGRYDAGSQRGSGNVEVVGPRARVTFSGDFDSMQVRATGGLEAMVSEVTPGLSVLLAQRQPVFAVIQKRPGDQPARVKSANLIAPLDGDMSRLDGAATIELGEARLALAPGMARLLKPLAGAGAARLQRFEPMQLVARRGVLEIAPWSFPLEEFTFRTQGTVDLVRRTVNVTTWVPAGALTAETLNSFNQQLSGLTGKSFGAIDEKLLVPLRTRGSLDAPTTTVELDQMALDELKRLAGKTLEDQLKNALTDKVKGLIPGGGNLPGGSGLPVKPPF